MDSRKVLTFPLVNCDSFCADDVEVYLISIFGADVQQNWLVRVVYW